MKFNDNIIDDLIRKHNIYLDDGIKNSIEEVGKYFMFIKPMECCKYCKSSNGEPIPAAIQIL